MRDPTMLPFSVATARRAWLAAKDMINAQPVSRLADWLASPGVSHE